MISTLYHALQMSITIIGLCTGLIAIIMVVSNLRKSGRYPPRLIFYAAVTALVLLFGNDLARVG